MEQQKHEKLVAQLNSGNIQVLRDIYCEFKHQLFTFCLHLLKDTEKAEDAVHETILKLLTHSKTIQNGKLLKSWLYTVARNECYTILRYQQKKEEITEDSVWDENGVQHSIEQREKKKIIADAIQNLKIQYREVVLLREYENLSYEEIGAITSTSVTTVKSRLFKARKMLAKKLHSYVEREEL